MIAWVKYTVFICATFLALHLNAQENPTGNQTTEEKEPTASLEGYLKVLPSYISFSEGANLFDVLLHNRLNFEWFPNEKFTFKASLRSRIFWGDQIKINPNFGKLIDQGSNDFIDLSLLAGSKNIVLHTYFDRFYAEYNTGEWEMRIGRQRVNWGISSIWNPNDIFNAYSFTDFDYEERPGSDALRIKKYFGFSSSFEFAFSPSDTLKNSTAAFLYKGHFKNYDYQILTGLYKNDIVLGLGWAGNIKTAGWKAEMSYFIPTEVNRKAAFTLAMNFDYAFVFGLYTNIGLLYNSEGGVNEGLNELFTTTLSARNLYPYRWSVMSTVASPLSPIMSISMTAVYSPVKSNALFLLPTYTFSVASDWDVDFVMQILFEQTSGKYKSPLQGYFLRTKYSF